MNSLSDVVTASDLWDPIFALKDRLCHSHEEEAREDIFVNGCSGAVSLHKIYGGLPYIGAWYDNLHMTNGDFVAIGSIGQIRTLSVLDVIIFAHGEKTLAIVNDFPPNYRVLNDWLTHNEIPSHYKRIQC